LLNNSHLTANEIKQSIREKVSEALVEFHPEWGGTIALPDAIYDLQLDHYITDFRQSDVANSRLIALPEWKNAQRVFITPDNSTRLLREIAIREEKEVIMTTYGIRRGSVLITRKMVPVGQEEYASTLVGMEKFGRSLPGIADLEAAGPVDIMVTGALAVSSVHGGRAGKGAGWFDAEWGIWSTLKLITQHTPVFCPVADVQVVSEAFALDDWDSRITHLATPSRLIRISVDRQPSGILWDKIITEKQMQWLQAIPYMSELYVRAFHKEFPLSTVQG
jgi:5-formyltetrahydrofolate cyclo-ligase